jgi:hypothetical protein
MRTSDEEYFRSCVAKERHLAQLLGHHVEEYYESAGTLWENTTALPQWTRDWSACGTLMTAGSWTEQFGHDRRHSCPLRRPSEQRSGGPVRDRESGDFVGGTWQEWKIHAACGRIEDALSCLIRKYFILESHR